MVDVLAGRVMIQEDLTLNAQTALDFFKKIEAAYPTKAIIHVFCDNAAYYRNKLIREHLIKSKVRLHFLPPYSPNLNPIERLWKWMKERIVYNAYYETFEDFREAVMGFFKGLSSLDPESELGKCFRSRIRDQSGLLAPLWLPLFEFDCV